MRTHRILLLGLGLFAAALLAAACGGDDEVAGPATSPDETVEDDTADDDTAAEGLPEVCEGQDGEGRLVGFGNLGEQVPFAVLVREGIESVAEQCNLEILNADNQLDPSVALDNARTFMSRGVDGIIWFQVDGEIAEAVCETIGDTPIIAIDIRHDPCAVFMGADNRVAGEITGRGAGELAQEQWDCDVDLIVTFEGFASGQVSIDRLNGAVAGVQEVCPDLEYGDFENWSPTEENSIVTRVDADRTDPAFAQGRDLLTANPDAERIIALCLNEDSCIGFHAAVQEAGRDGQVIFSSNGADPTGHELIRQDPNYAGATGFFPERYGELLVPNIIRMMNGEPPASDPLLMDHVYISDENIDEFYPG